jgi:hypothetical protein
MKSTVSQIEIDEQGVAWISGANTKVTSSPMAGVRKKFTFNIHICHWGKSMPPWPITMSIRNSWIPI